MKKLILCILLCIFIITIAMAQPSFTEEVTAFYAYGLAGEDQILSDEYNGVYSEQKNGYYVTGSLAIKKVYGSYLDLFIELNTKSSPGASYLPLQLSYSSQKDFSLSLNSVYASIHVLDVVMIGKIRDIPDLMFNLKAGKYDLKAADLKVSRYGLESALNMIKTSGSHGASLIALYTFKEGDQYSLELEKYSSITLELASHGMFDEAIARLYDTDGGFSPHGEVVLGEYAPQIFATARILDYFFPFGIISADASYAYNGAGLYSGHSAGVSARFNTIIIPDSLFLPLGLSFAYYEKNIDTLGATATIESSPYDASTDFRNTIRAGIALGVQYIINTPDYDGEYMTKFPHIIADLTIAGSFTHIQHIYRDPLSLFGLCVDGRFTLDKKFYIGGGLIMGTLMDAVWQTSEGVDQEDYLATFRPAENLGYEIYAGLNVPDITGSFSLGFVNNHGLAMNYGLESIKDGLIKYSQPGTEPSDKLWETCSVYIKYTGKL